MNFLEKLDTIMKKQNLNKNTLSIKSGVPYTTIDGFYKKGYENVKMSTIKKIAFSLDVTLDFLMNDDISFETNQSTSDSSATPQILQKYNSLNPLGQQKADDYITDLSEQPKYTK